MVKKIIVVLNYTEEILLAYVSLGLAILIVIEILLRSTGITAFYWLEELGRYVLILITLCGASLAVKRVRHPTMTALLTSVPKRVSHLILVITSLFLAVFFAYADYFAWMHIAHVQRVGFQTSTLGIPFFIPYLPIGVFFLAICVRYVLRAVNEFRLFINPSLEAGE